MDQNSSDITEYSLFFWSKKNFDFITVILTNFRKETFYKFREIFDEKNLIKISINSINVDF